MGGGSSVPFNYQAQLFAAKKAQANPQGQDAKSGEPEGETWPRRHVSRAAGPDALTATVNTKDGSVLKTIWEAFQYGVKINPGGKLFGTRSYEADGKTRGDYVWLTYEQVDKITRQLGAGLRKKCGVGANANIGLYSKNRVEWVVSSLANFSQSMRSVALYDTLGEEAVAHILRQAEIPVVGASKDKLANLFAVKKASPDIPLKFIVQFDDNQYGNEGMDSIDEADEKQAAELGLTILSYTQLIQEGEAALEEMGLTEPTPEDLAFIMYTSGTTGLPKGAMLSHGNLIGSSSSALDVFPVTGDDVHVSYLPLAHIFETIVQTIYFFSGAAIGFYSGDVRALVGDFMTLNPTILCGVPRVFSKIYQRVMSKVEEGNCIKSFVFHKALADSSNAIRSGQRVPRWDNKVWIPAREKVGLQRCRLIVTGAAPMPPYLAEFLKVMTGARLVQGYGMTETAAAVAVSFPDDDTVGHVGPPLTCCEIKLVDIPEMGYTSRDEPHPRGEIWARGHNVFQGYLDNEEETKKTLMGDGWIATGDVGRWNPNNTLSIIDRKKNIFKLAQGEYIAVEKVENVYAKSPALNQIWVYGNSFKSFIVAVVVPAPDWVVKEAKAKGFWHEPDDCKLPSKQFIDAFATLWKKHHDELKAIVLASMRAHQTDLKGFEKVRDILIESKIDEMGQGFSVEDNLLTPSFKLKRPNLLKKYVGQLKDLYASNGEPPNQEEEWVK